MEIKVQPKETLRIQYTTMFNFKKTTALIFSLTFILHVCQACSCINSQSFINGIESDRTIAQVRILEHIDLPDSLIRHELYRIHYPEKFKMFMDLNKRASMESSIGAFPFSHFSYTTLLVEEIYLGNVKLDAIGFLNGDNAQCEASLNRRNVGSRLILKMYHDEQHKLSGIEKIRDSHSFIFNHPMFTTTTCITSELKANKGMVYGFISNNKRFELLAKTQNESLSESKRGEIYTRMRKFKPESMPIEEFRKRIDDKVRSLK